MRYTREVVDRLAKTDYFRDSESPPCVAILPMIEPEHVGVEIGVFYGKSSKLFLDHCAFMYFVDPCKPYKESSDPDIFAVADNFRSVIEPYGPERFIFLEQFSADASASIPSVDFVFIDGNHAKDYVAQDIALYWPKVRSGGFLSGHDYNQLGVREAVHEFATKNPHLSVELHQDCWVIKKP